VAETVKLVDPRLLKVNVDNPRLIFRQKELDELQKSIENQGILVPLSVFQEGKRFQLLDGERRWRCALKLGFSSVPVIVQPKPARLQNLMMMFAIHHARKDWDPLPTAIKLEDLEKEFRDKQGRDPSESELAGLASMSRGEVRRLKKLLRLPKDYRKELLEELEKPRSEQILTVDQVLEATTAASALHKRGILDKNGEDDLRRAIVRKFKSRVEVNTVAPRLLAKLARGVQRNEVSMKVARRVADKLVTDPRYSISDAFRDSVEQSDFEHNLEQMVGRVIDQLKQHKKREYKISEGLLATLKNLRQQIEHMLEE
jgi:ParB family transcriptional regulator, chromosome partitioning protein